MSSTDWDQIQLLFQLHSHTLFQNRVIDAGSSSAKKKRKNKKKASENEQVDTQCHTRTSRRPIKKFLRKEQISGILFVAHVRRRGEMRPLSVYVN
jgi:hypothetical protein